MIETFSYFHSEQIRRDARGLRNSIKHLHSYSKIELIRDEII